MILRPAWCGGFLCRSCNLGLGMFGDDRDKGVAAIGYLVRAVITPELPPFENNPIATTDAAEREIRPAPITGALSLSPRGELATAAGALLTCRPTGPWRAVLETALLQRTRQQR